MSARGRFLAAAVLAGLCAVAGTVLVVMGADRVAPSGSCVGACVWLVGSGTAIGTGPLVAFIFTVFAWLLRDRP